MTCCRSLVHRARCLCLLAAASALTPIFGPVLAQTPAPVAEQVFTQIVNWKRVRGTATELAISANGAVFALGTQGEVWRWNGKESWSRLPGMLARITVDPQGALWGVDLAGRVLQYRGNYWTPLPGEARDLNIGPDGSLWMIGADGVPARWDASGASVSTGGGIGGNSGGDAGSSAGTANTRDTGWRALAPAVCRTGRANDQTAAGTVR